MSWIILHESLKGLDFFSKASMDFKFFEQYSVFSESNLYEIDISIRLQVGHLVWFVDTCFEVNPLFWLFVHALKYAIFNLQKNRIIF